MPLSCVLFSDITGSTQLYEREGGQAALAHVGAVLARMRAIVEGNRGTCVKSQGDDVLSHFDRPDDAFAAACAMINESWPGGMAIHAGLYFGDILHDNNDIYGGAVNTAARLCALAKPGEALLGDRCHDLLSQANRDRLTGIGALQLRGKDGPTDVYSCTVSPLAEQTVFVAPSRARQNGRAVPARITHAGQTWMLAVGEKLTFGRSHDCDVVLTEAWVSRKHAEILFNGKQIEFTDHSSTGSVLQDTSGQQTTIHRRTTLLSGVGTIFLGIGMEQEPGRAIAYATTEG